MKARTPVIMPEHIKHSSGKVKTVCVTACLTAIGVPFEGFKVTGTLEKPNYLSILNKFGFQARSRKSKMPKGATIGKCRKAIDKLGEDALYLVILFDGAKYCHAILLNNQGQTIVDTDPRKNDRRKVHTIHAISKSC